MRINSSVTGREYWGEKMVYISNPLQAARYIKHSATIYDIISDGDRLIFIFNKEETKHLFNSWCLHELL